MTSADEKTVAQLDRDYQLAVKNHDKVVTGKELEDRARKAEVKYEQQDEVDGTQTVRVWGDTAVASALLWIKGWDATRGDFDYKVWFSDTYVRSGGRWRYAFGQASLPLPKEP